MGMNFQTPNVAQKNFGYADASGAPAPGLAAAYDFVDGQQGRVLSEMDAQGITDSTLFILAAKHGNSPIDPALKRTTDDGPYQMVINGVTPGLLASRAHEARAFLARSATSRGGGGAGPSIEWAKPGAPSFGLTGMRPDPALGNRGLGSNRKSAKEGKFMTRIGLGVVLAALALAGAPTAKDVPTVTKKMMGREFKYRVTDGSQSIAGEPGHIVGPWADRGVCSDNVGKKGEESGVLKSSATLDVQFVAPFQTSSCTLKGKSTCTRLVWRVRDPIRR
jgi:hypothetical protein